MIQQLLAARGRLQRVDRWIKPFLLQGAIEMQLHVAGAFEFLENDFVHAAARLGQRGRENSEAAPFLGIARRTEKFLRLGQRFRLHTARHDPAFARLQIIITARQSRDAVEQNHHVFF